MHNMKTCKLSFPSLQVLKNEYVCERDKSHIYTWQFPHDAFTRVSKA